eukprot:SAG11_NODE_840_length_6909_cov_27.081057_6_plen_139_part_00
MLPLELQRLNSVLKIYGEFLLGRKSRGVFRANTTKASGGGKQWWGVAIPYPVHNPRASTTTTATSGGGGGGVPSSASVVESLSNQGHWGDWLLGEFDLVNAPRWGAPAGRRPAGAIPALYRTALLLQNQDENRNAWCV